jgi:hypothetical protein
MNRYRELVKKKKQDQSEQTIPSHNVSSIKSLSEILRELDEDVFLPVLF